jgi:hypothetical protein
LAILRVDAPQRRAKEDVVSDQAQSASAGRGADVGDLTMSAADREVLRGLAGRVAELAARDAERHKRDLWYRHNALEPTRPLVFCDPENGWKEIVTEEQMRCTGRLARGWERRLRKEVFWGESMGDDRVVEPHFDVNHVHTESDWGMRERRIGGDGGGAYTWEAPLASYDEIDRLRFPEIRVDRRATQDVLSLAGEAIGDLLTVRLKGRWWWSLGMTWTLINLRGATQVLLDMYDYPQQLKRLMAFLRDGTLAKLDYLESGGLLSLNNDGTYVGSGGFGYTRELPRPGFDPDKVRTCDMWGFCESQETAAVSPDMFAEFVFAYQLPILERFGLNCYGCCEPLDARWRVIAGIPRLRRVSVSPWADLEKMAEYLGEAYIYSMKPNPSPLAAARMDEGRVRDALRRALEITRGCRVEIIMKDNHTIGHNPDNVIRWCRIAREEAQRA